MLMLLGLFWVLCARRQVEPAITCDKDTMTVMITESLDVAMSAASVYT